MYISYTCTNMLTLKHLNTLVYACKNTKCTKLNKYIKVHICDYVNIYIYVIVYRYTCVYIYIYTHTCIHCVNKYVCISNIKKNRMYTCMSLRVHKRICTCRPVNICAYVYGNVESVGVEGRYPFHSLRPFHSFHSLRAFHSLHSLHSFHSGCPNCFIHLLVPLPSEI